MKKLIIVMFLIGLVVGCGTHVQIPQEIINNHSVEADKKESLLTTVSIPILGECVFLVRDVWIENEGSKADIYNNDLCDHGPSPLKVFCDNIVEGQVCWVGKFMFSITGTGSNMSVNKVNFNGK